MSEEEIIKVFMIKEIVEDVCNPIEDHALRGKCVTILRKILTSGEGFEELKELPEEAKDVIREKLRELGVG